MAPLERAEEPLLHLRSRDRVEGGERLVQEQDLLLGHQRPKERDALAHAAGELGRLWPSNSPRPNRSNSGRAFARAVAFEAPRFSSASAALSSALRQGSRRSFCGIRAQWRSRSRAARSCTDPDRSVRRLEQSRDGEEERRLAAAARADDREPLVSRDGEIRLLEHMHVAELMANALDDDVRRHPLVLFRRRYRRVRVQIPILGCSDI